MNGDNTDSKADPSDEVEYHTYPYSYSQTKNEEDEEVFIDLTDIDSEKEEIAVEADVDEPAPDNGSNNEHGADEPIPDIKENNGDGAATDKVENVIPENKKVVENAGYDNNKKQDDPVTSGNLRNNDTPVPERKSRKLQYITIAAVLLLIIGASFVLIYQTFNGDLYPSDGKVAVIYVQGTLLTSSIPGGLGYATSEEISENIRDAVNDEDIKAIVLRINSPGGSSTAGEEVYSEVKKASEDGVPVVISMGDVAASAAYHISAPADLIVANPSTMTGSIGTIWTFQNLSEFYDEEGVEFYVAKSGEFKDMGAPWRGLSEDEKEYANKVIVEVYTSFINDVAEGRGMSVGEVKDLADGRIYTGRKAKELGLVDEFGNLYDAIDRAAELGGIEGDATVIYMNKPSLSSLLFGSEADASVAVDEFLRYHEESPYGQLT
ncbi:signal peptide peptidase SppA [Methanolobus sp. ZRKC3]|uniref:signal peptide peptidase SppA n=1 Tax=Methanolobus sp. ZRKC3 TaxID=3125786 RepID=UPI00324CC15F